MSVKLPSIGDVVMFTFEASAGRQHAPALVLESEHTGLTLVFVDNNHTYSDEMRDVGAIVIVRDVPHADQVRDEIDGSVLAPHWTELR